MAAYGNHHRTFCDRRAGDGPGTLLLQEPKIRVLRVSCDHGRDGPRGGIDERRCAQGWNGTGPLAGEPAGDAGAVGDGLWRIGRVRDTSRASDLVRGRGHYFGESSARAGEYERDS